MLWLRYLWRLRNLHKYRNHSLEWPLEWEYEAFYPKVLAYLHVCGASYTNFWQGETFALLLFIKHVTVTFLELEQEVLRLFRQQTLLFQLQCGSRQWKYKGKHFCYFEHSYHSPRICTTHGQTLSGYRTQRITVRICGCNELVGIKWSHDSLWLRTPHSNSLYVTGYHAKPKELNLLLKVWRDLNSYQTTEKSRSISSRQMYCMQK